MSHEPAADDENPFSTRFVRPGALGYVFPDSTDLEQLVLRWRQAGQLGEIIGPHGSGKSTLLTGLLAKLNAEGWQTSRCDLRDGQRSLPPGWLRQHCREPRTVLAIDGFEQLSRWQRFRTLAGCRKQSAGLVVTAHATVGLPALWTTQVDAPRATALFQELTDGKPPFVTLADLLASLQRHPTDLRTTWFELYDLYEERRRSVGEPT